jgi:glutaredoxin-like protein
MSEDSEIVMYGAQWCGDCRRSKRLLDELNVDYTYVDVEANPDEIETVKAYNNGAQSIPVIVFSDGSHLTEPSDPALREKLAEVGAI